MMRNSNCCYNFLLMTICQIAISFVEKIFSNTGIKDYDHNVLPLMERNRANSFCEFAIEISAVKFE
jgi:hypothetical protein